MASVGWGIVGPGDIAHNFAAGLAACESGRLVAIAGRNPERRHAFGDRFGVARRHARAADLFRDPAVQAVYIATPHPFHARLGIGALRAGKPVLCEKPAGVVAGEVTAVTGVAAQTGLFFMEGLMYRFHPQIARLLEILKSGAVGRLRHMTARFGFASDYDPASRLYDPALAGGAILDVGIYPVSLARLVAGVAAGLPFAEPEQVTGLGLLAPSGVDREAHALLKFPGGFIADCATAIDREMENEAVITGDRGCIRLPDPWAPGRDAGPSDARIDIEVDGRRRTETIRDPRILFAHEAEQASRAILAGQTEVAWPGPGWADSAGTARVLDAWRQAVGYRLACEQPAGLVRLTGCLPPDRPAMPRASLGGLAVSRLILGCDNRDTLAEGAIVWDAWWEAGGNAFDTGFIYGDGLHETLLGQWLAARGLTREAVVIVKGGHTPYCLPDVLEAELVISLERLRLDRAPVYVMHRDNPDVPVDEFVDALNALRDKGLVDVCGGSNWSIARFRAANAHAAATGRPALALLNNNLSLAVMERPVWPGCISANNPESLAFLRESGTAHLSWSSQARGYFMPEDRTNGPAPGLEAGTTPDICFASPANAERRRRATELATQRRLPAHNIATAWVLGQSFPSFALIGPRSPNELATTLPALTVSLTPGELAWLNLESETR